MPWGRRGGMRSAPVGHQINGGAAVPRSCVAMGGCMCVAAAALRQVSASACLVANKKPPTRPEAEAPVEHSRGEEQAGPHLPGTRSTARSVSLPLLQARPEMEDLMRLMKEEQARGNTDAAVRRAAAPGGCWRTAGHAELPLGLLCPSAAPSLLAGHLPSVPTPPSSAQLSTAALLRPPPSAPPAGLRCRCSTSSACCRCGRSTTATPSSRCWASLSRCVLVWLRPMCCQP